MPGKIQMRKPDNSITRPLHLNRLYPIFNNLPEDPLKKPVPDP